MGHSSWPFVINLGNSIVGVSVLAMPFCFKQCGIVLGTVLLLSSAWLTQVSCRLLMRAAISSKKRSYEFLALHTFGGAGKLAVEVSIIGLLIGTCVAFHVIIGDLGPNIISKMTGLQNTPQLRTSLMVFLGLCVALPLGLLRNVESLSNVSAISIGFYTVFVADVFFTAFPNLWSGAWVSKVEFWRLEGVFQCLPIFALAFACQTQLFVMYDALPEPSLTMMNGIINSALWLCTAMYLMVGFFGYIAFCDSDVGGDVLMSFKPTIFTESIKLGFTLSVALSFPLIIFPMRASINTLLCSQIMQTSDPFQAGSPRHSHENFSGASIIPPFRFRVITCSVVIGTLIIGILVPNVEFVLGMTGSTMGTMISFIFPAVMFISVTSSSKADGKMTAQLVLFIGVTVLLASTYTTLNQQDKQRVNNDIGNLNNPTVKLDQVNVMEKPKLKEPPKEIVREEKPLDLKAVPNINEQKKPVDVKNEEKKDEKRQEPPIPNAPNDQEEKNIKTADEIDKIKKAEGKQDESDRKKINKAIADDNAREKKDIAIQAKKQKIAEKKLKETEKKQKDILSKLELQQQQQAKLINEQKELLAELKQHKKDAHSDQSKGARNLVGKQQAAQNNQQNVPDNNKQQIPADNNHQEVPKKDVKLQNPAEQNIPADSSRLKQQAPNAGIKPDGAAGNKQQDIAAGKQPNVAAGIKQEIPAANNLNAVNNAAQNANNKKDIVDSKPQENIQPNVQELKNPNVDVKDAKPDSAGLGAARDVERPVEKKAIDESDIRKQVDVKVQPQEIQVPSKDAVRLNKIDDKNQAKQGIIDNLQKQQAQVRSDMK